MASIGKNHGRVFNQAGIFVFGASPSHQPRVFAPGGDDASDIIAGNRARIAPTVFERPMLIIHSIGNVVQTLGIFDVHCENTLSAFIVAAPLCRFFRRWVAILACNVRPIKKIPRSTMAGPQIAILMPRRSERPYAYTYS